MATTKYTCRVARGVLGVSPPKDGVEARAVAFLCRVAAEEGLPEAGLLLSQEDVDGHQAALFATRELLAEFAREEARRAEG